MEVHNEAHRSAPVCSALSPRRTYPFVVEYSPSLLMKYFDMVKNRMNMGRLAIAAMAIMIPSSLWVSAMNLVMYNGIVFISSLYSEQGPE